MKFLKNLLALNLLLALHSGCQKDVDYLVPDNNNIGQTLNPNPVQASVIGKVLDENNDPVQGAVVKSGNTTSTTDSRGLFRFSNITLDQYASVVSVENAGYFKAIRTFSAKASSVNFIKIKLIPKVLLGTINANSGGSVSLSNGSSIFLPQNGVVNNANNQSYSGDINVYAAYIDPTSNDIEQLIPGSFQAMDVNNFRVSLKSFGMMAVQLENQQGEKLQIAAGKKAKLSFSIPVALVSSAPTQIPLWSLNETSGLWMEEGNAAKNGGKYEGEVSHFSFWNCDIGNNTIFLETRIVTGSAPLPFTLVRITRTDNGSTSYGFTDSSGYVSGLVPSNTGLMLEVLSGCAQAVYSQNIGPFSQNTNLGNINVTLPASSRLLITGNAVSCNGNAVLNGNALIYFEGQPFSFPIVNGEFSGIITRCGSASANIEVIAVDNDNQQQSSITIASVSSDSINVGTLTACALTTQQFISYSINDTTRTFTFPPDSLNHYLIQGSTISSILGSDQNSLIEIRFNTSGISQGTSQSLVGFTSSYIGGGTSTTINSPIAISITEYGAVGQFIAGNFAGIVRGNQPQNTSYNITCSFRVRRAF